MKSKKIIGIAILLGSVFGTIIGLTINNLTLWIAIGIALGTGVGFTLKLKKYPKLKWTLISIFSLLVLLISFGAWFINLLPLDEMKKDLSASKVEDISYLSENVIPTRGKILAVVTSTETMGNSGKSTGYELTELSRTYYVFKANGFEVDIASPLGGKPPVVIDDEDMGVFDYAFLNDSVAQYKANNNSTLFDTISKTIIDNRLYLEPDLSLSKLAALVGQNTQKTSSVINQHAKRNFNDFINYYRIQDAKKILLDKDNEKFTISSIAFDTGFSSLSSFNSAFKKFEGMTPSSFRKK